MGTSLVVQWLGLCVSKAWDAASIPGQRMKTLHATWNGQKIKSKRNNQKTIFSD